MLAFPRICVEISEVKFLCRFEIWQLNHIMNYESHSHTNSYILKCGSRAVIWSPAVSQHAAREDGKKKKVSQWFSQQVYSAQILKTRGGALLCLFTLARRPWMISWLTVDFFNPIKAWNDRWAHRHAASHGLFLLFRNQWWCRVCEEEAEHPVTDSSQSTRMGAL